ncbi:MAG TPA: hypothetical protein H9878_03685 [Candidatus Dietzia merdigallinarum]|nr:hypothetical protein [Candidatus Dietzia merdigallinarum]
MTVSLELLGRGPSRPDLLEDLVMDEASIAEALRRWSVKAPVVVTSDPVTGLPALDDVMEVLTGGTPAVVDVVPGLAAITGTAGTPVGGAATGPDSAQSAAHLADLLAVASHAGVGFGSGLVPRCADASQVWAMLSGAVAAMTGADIRAAVAAPDPARIVGLGQSAREAIRDVVTCVLVPAGQVEQIVAALAAATDG